MKYENTQKLIEQFRKYRYDSQQSYESMAREIGVAYTTIFRWLNSVKEINIGPLHAQAISNFLKSKNFLNLLLAITVSWQLSFNAGRGWTRYEKSKEFETYKEVADFVMHSPEENKVFECEHWGEHGYCAVSNLKIEN